MPNIEKFLEPKSGDNPCGEDLWAAEGRFGLQQPLETAWKNSEPPNWTEVRDGAQDLLGRTRDLRVAVILCLAWFRTEPDKLLGFRDGLALIQSLVEKYWDRLHPVPEDAEDPSRSNTLSNLSAPLGSDTPFQFVKFLREAPLCRTPTGTVYSLADLDRADNPPKGQGDLDGKPVPTRPQIEAALKSSEPKLAETRKVFEEITAHVEAIETFTSGRLGSNVSFSFTELTHTLESINKELGGAAGEQPGLPQTAAPQSAPSATGELGPVNSREGAEAALRAVARYLRATEPSSPVPLLLDRALRLMGKDFMDSMRDLAPDSLERFNTLFGIKEASPQDKPES